MNRGRPDHMERGDTPELAWVGDSAQNNQVQAEAAAAGGVGGRRHDPAAPFLCPPDLNRSLNVMYPLWDRFEGCWRARGASDLRHSALDWLLVSNVC